MTLKVMLPRQANFIEIRKVSVHRFSTQEYSLPRCSSGADEVQMICQPGLCVLCAMQRIPGSSFDSQPKRFSDSFHKCRFARAIFADKHCKGEKVQPFI
nr:hypothetical protein [Kocuria marina]